MSSEEKLTTDLKNIKYAWTDVPIYPETETGATCETYLW